MKRLQGVPEANVGGEELENDHQLTQFFAGIAECTFSAMEIMGFVLSAVEGIAFEVHQ